MSSSRIYSRDTPTFIEKSKQMFPERISSYEKTIYKGDRQPITLECAEHGEFTVTPRSHFNAFGCPECKKIKKSKSHKSQIVVDVEEFKRRANEVFGEGTYDYSKVDFDVQTEKVTIICPLHGEFKMEARTHTRGRGCKECAKTKFSKPKTKEHFLKKAEKIHGDALDFTDSIYVGIDSPITARCTYHDSFFETTPHKLYRGYGCRFCWYETINNQVQIKEKSSERSATLYHIKIFRKDNTSFEKVGITTKNLDKRFDSIKLEGFKYEVLGKYDMTLYDAKRCEEMIMTDLIENKNKYRIRDLKGTRTGGWTECFPNDVCDVNSIVETYKIET